METISVSNRNESDAGHWAILLSLQVLSRIAIISMYNGKGMT